MAFNVCLCGAPAGYPHAEDCPYPLYHGNQKQEEDWIHANIDLNIAIQNRRDAEYNAKK